MKNIGHTLRGLTTEERFFKQVLKTRKKCWVWTGHKTKAGRPVITHHRKQIYAHRFSYTHFIGKIPEGLYVCHHCDNKLCVNPSHLFVGTQADNMEDMRIKDRANKPKGESNGRAKLTDEIVRYIRTHYRKRHPTFGQTALAKRFSVSVFTIQEVIYRNKWTHVS